MSRAHIASVLGFAMLLACCACAFALDPSLDINQYAHTSWKIRDGFTKGTIFSMAQTPDGYLWLGTEFGLVRFDGVQAIPWQPPHGEQLPSTWIETILVANDGTLWIGTEKGLASWKEDKLTQYPEVAGHFVTSLLQDVDGTLWFGVRDPGMLCAVQVKNTQCYGAGSFGWSVPALYRDHKGNLWVSAETGLWRWAPGTPVHYPLGNGPVEARALLEDDNGALLAATGTSGPLASSVTGLTKGLKQFRNGKIQSYPLLEMAGQFRPTSLFRSRDGNLWVGTTEGLLHLHQARLDSFSVADGLSGDYIRNILEDREGNVWVSTEGGLDRFREFAIPTMPENEEGLSAVTVLEATPDGSVWIATADGLKRWQNRHMLVYGKQSGHVARRTGGVLVRDARTTEVTNSGLRNTVYSLGQDDQGRLWAANSDGLFYFDRERFVQVPDVPGGNVLSIAGDRQGKVWISNNDDGLFYSTPHGPVQHIPWARFGHKYGAASLLSDRSRGGVWLGFIDGGISYLKDGKIRSSYDSADGLGKGSVNDLQLGSDGGVWAATEGGLSRLKDGVVTTLTSRNGLPCDAINWAIEDNEHSFWLYMPCGLVRIQRSDLDAWVGDSKRRVQAIVFDSSDGVRSRALPGPHGRKVTKSADGKIWFSAPDAVSIIDPHHLPSNRLPPPLHIEEIIADGKTYEATRGLRLPPLVRNLEIHYTALSLAAPEKVRFRVKLEGQDEDWKELVNDRHVHYTNLAPKHYRFRVLASNNSGVWNEEGAVLDFAVDPAYWQTNWFRALCAAAFLGLLWAAYRLRVRQLQEQEKKFREAVEAMPALAFVARPDGHRTFINKGWIEYTGMTLERASGPGWQAAIHPDDLKRVLDKWRSSLATGDPLDYEARLRRANGDYRWFLTRVVPLGDKRGKNVRWCGVATDIEDRKRAEQLQSDLAHVNRVSMLGELAASLSHELRQPITAAITSANAALRWLNRDQPDVARASETTANIVEDGTRAAEIIDRLRSLYKKSLPQRELVEVNEIIGEMVVLLRGEANRCAVSVRTDLAADLPKILADRVQVQQVLMNLMLNALEAMKDTGGVMTVKSQPEDGQVVISVSDTGVGLPAEKADQIFNAFFTTKPQGSGMGLAISRSILESHGGRLWATANDGRGATFHFTLPVATEAMKVPAAGTRLA